MASTTTVRLKPLQSGVFASKRRFRVVVAGRRSGKTYGMCCELLKAALGSDGARAWYIAPSYRMARDIAWKTLKAIIPDDMVARKPNESFLTVNLTNGSEISLKGADDPDRLRGPGLDFVGMDEFAWIQPAAWFEVLRPALADKQGRALFTTTPAGYNWAYDLFLRGNDPEFPDWGSWQYTTADAGIVKPEEIEAARRDSDPRLFRQEYEASFETLQGRVYDNFDRDESVAQVVDTAGELLVGLDFNINPMSATVAVRVGDECHVLDSFEVLTSNTEEIAGELRIRYPARRIVICPDPSGRARKTSAPVGQTDFTILERAGFELRAPRQAPLVVDRINNVQAMLRNSEGRRRVKIHPRAQTLIRSLDGLTYKEGTSAPDKSLGLDHTADAFGYLLWSEFNVLQRQNVPTMYEVAY